MLSRNLKVLRYAGIFLSVAMLCSVLAYPFMRGESAPPAMADLEKQMEAVKTKLESPDSSPVLLEEYYHVANALSNCSAIGQVTRPTINAPFMLPPSICINGALAVADPTFNRPLASSTGTGIGNGTLGNCSLSGTATAAFHDVYSFNLTGCTVFPTEITATLCGPAGCQHLGNVDTMMTLYRNVPAGDPLTANGGLPAVFNPASPCTNARGGQDDLGTVAGTTNNPGGSTCNQVVGANCVAPCTSPSNAGALSGFRRQVGSGRFTIVVAGFSNSTTGSYNLFVNAPAAGCNVALAPTAASATIGGQVRTAGGNGISKAIVTLSGNGIETMQVRTNGFGYYSFGEVPVGENYVLTVNGTKMHTFANPTRVVSLEASISDADFVSEQ